MLSGKKLSGLSYHVVGGNLSIDATMRVQGAKAVGMDRADILIFQGGQDISPSLYDSETHARCGIPNHRRDAVEKAIYEAASKTAVFKVGICRGAQLLHALNGGKLWQHVMGHDKDHDMLYYDENHKPHKLTVSSTHHQMMMLNDRSRSAVWGFASETHIREFPNGGPIRMTRDHWCDPEIVHYKDTATLCFQPHPEHLTAKETRQVFYDCLIRMVEE